MNRLPHEIHITGEMRLAGPLTQEKLLETAFQPWHRFEEKKKIKLDLLSTLEELVQRGTVFLWEQDGRYYLKPKSAGAGPVPEPAIVNQPEGEQMATAVADKKKRGRPPKDKSAEDEPVKPAKASKAESNGDDNGESSLPPPEKFKELKTDAETSDALAIAENDAAKAKSEVEIKSALRRIAVAKYDYAVIMREHLKTSDGDSVDDIRAAQKEVDKAQKIVTRASADRREARAAYDAVNERISQILLRRLPLFD